MPKWTVSMPTAFTNGMSSGVRSRMALNGSRKQPTRRSRRLIASSNSQAETLSDWIHATIAAGTWFTVRSQAKTLAQATMISTWPVKSAVVDAASSTSRQPSSRNTSHVTNTA